MKHKWAAWLFPLLLIGGWMWLYQLRFTPAAAARSVPSVKGAVVETTPFPGGAAVLLAEGARYSAVATCRWGLILWRPCNSTSFWMADEDEPIGETASWGAHGKEGWGISLFAGLVYDERVATIVWGDEQRELKGARHYLFARRTQWKDDFARAVALSATGQELYEWSPQTYYQWTPVTAPVVTGCPALPEGWTRVAPGPGTVVSAVFALGSSTIYAGVAEGGVLKLEPDRPVVPVGTHRYENFRVSPDGRTLVGGVAGELWRLDLDTGEEQPLGLKSHGVLAWASPTVFLYVDISQTPDHTVASYDLQAQAGRSLTGTEGTSTADWQQPVVEIQRLGGFPAFAGSLSPDGTQLLFSQGHSGNGQVLRLDLQSGRMYTYPRTSGDGFSPVWEPDGRHALHGWGPLFRLDTLTGEVEPLDLGFPAIRIGDSAPDGRLLVQAHADGAECWVMGRQGHP